MINLSLNLELLERKMVLSPFFCEFFICTEGRVCWDQRFLNWTAHQNHLETQSAGPTLQVSDSVDRGSDQECSFLTGPQVVPMLLDQGLYS